MPHGYIVFTKSRLAIRVLNFLVHTVKNAKGLNEVTRFETVIILKWVLCKCFAAVYRDDCGKVHSWLQCSYMEMNGLDKFGNIPVRLFVFCTTQTLLWLIYTCFYSFTNTLLDSHSVRRLHKYTHRHSQVLVQGKPSFMYHCVTGPLSVQH